jgi:hypothetical protein
MRSWTNHIRGAAALISLRGQLRLQDEAGFKMFLYVRRKIVGLFTLSAYVVISLISL